MRIPLACLALLLASACRPDAPPTTAPAAAEPVPATAGNAGAPAPADAVSASFRCGDLLVGARFDNTRREVVLTPGPGRLVLPQAVAASGARHADTAGNEFWNKGDAATLTLDGQRHECVRTDQVSPWDEARARGVAFRGLGTEPFWALEVDATPAIRLDLDAGERRLVVGEAVVLQGGEGYAGTADDGNEVTLRIGRGDCSDGMSDQRYPAVVELQVGDDTFRGCGGFLEP